jgi:hypothetical protein
MCAINCYDGFFEDQYNICQKCDPICGNCVKSSTTCLTCNDLFLYNNTCLKVCPNGYFED